MDFDLGGIDMGYWPVDDLLKHNVSDEDLTQLDDESAWGSTIDEKGMFDFDDTEGELFNGTGSFLSSLELPSENSPESQMPSFLAFDSEPAFGQTETPLNREEPHITKPQHTQPPMQQQQQLPQQQQQQMYTMQHSAPVYPVGMATVNADKTRRAPMTNNNNKRKMECNTTTNQRKKANFVSSMPTFTPQVIDAPMPTRTDSSDKHKQTSSFRGVSCCGKDRKWQARIRDANRVRYLGRFSTEVEAALVYDEAARTLKGDRAPTNFVKMDPHVKDELKSSFIANNYSVPDHMLHYVVRVKGKQTARKPATTRPTAVKTDPYFPDSPMAKVKGAAPVISPSASKSTAHKKRPDVHARLNLDTPYTKGGVAPYSQQQQQQPHALMF